ncbi:hypothetical protein CsSME_00023004 [Camellia sinensis var. sinensis]
MCHPGLPLTSLRDLAQQRRWNVLERPVVVRRPTATGRVPGIAVEAAAQGGGGRLNQCVCSPTRHPGSFRCRHHHDEYVWGGRGGGGLIQAASRSS